MQARAGHVYSRHAHRRPPRYVSAEAVNKSAAAKARMVDVGAPPAGYLDGYMSSALTSMYDSSGNLSSMLSSVSISDSKAYVSESLSSWRKAIW